MNYGQGELFACPPDMPLRGAGARRTRIGGVVEEMACAALRLRLLPKGRTDACCPDAEDETGRKYEIKSVSVNSKGKGKSVIYDWRLRKERAHFPRLTYVFFLHRNPGRGKAKRLSEWIDRQAAVPPVLLLVPLAAVEEAAARCPLNAAPKPGRSKRCGHARKGYDEGYRNVPVAALAERSVPVRTVAFSLWGRELAFEVRLVAGR